MRPLVMGVPDYYSPKLEVMKEVKVLAFGVVRDIIGKDNLIVKNIDSTDALMSHLENNFPRLKEIKYAIAVNKQLVDGIVNLETGATIALLPPFSGG